MQKINTSIIIPTHYKEKNIYQLLYKIIKIFPKNYEIIIITEKDSSDKRLKHFLSRNKIIKVNLSKHIGKGGSIIEGFKKSRGDIVGFIDCDDAFDVHSIMDMVELLKKSDNLDCVIASKWKDQSFFDVNERLFRKILSRGWNILVRSLLNLHYSDSQGGAKFLKKRVLDSIALDFICTGFDFDVELLCKIQKKRFKIKEIFIPSKFDKDSTFKIRHTIPMFKNLIRRWLL